METKILKAICLKSTDYGDNDKMLLLFSPEAGKFSAHIKGVKKAQAKLKFAAQPFCFGEYELIEKNGRFLVANCREIESFYSVGKDVDAYYCAATEAEFVSLIALENESNLPLFLLFLRSLALLAQNKSSARIVLIKFLLDGLQIAGFGLNFSQCNVCGSKTTSTLFLDMENGGAVCFDCKGQDSAELSAAIQNCLKQVENTPGDRLFVLKIDVYAKEILSLLSRYIHNHIKKLNSIAFLY